MYASGFQPRADGILEALRNLHAYFFRICKLIWKDRIMYTDESCQKWKINDFREMRITKAVYNADLVISDFYIIFSFHRLATECIVKCFV